MKKVQLLASLFSLLILPILGLAAERANLKPVNKTPAFAVEFGEKDFVADMTMHKIHQLNSNTLYITATNETNWVPNLFKYNTDGKQIWKSEITLKSPLLAPGPTHASGLTTDINNNTFITGFKCSLIPISVIFKMENYCGYFLAKFKAKGEQEWVIERPSDDFNYYARKVARDIHGNIFVIGIMKGTEQTQQLMAKAPGFIFVSKFDKLGTLQWFKKYDDLIEKEAQLEIHDTISDGINIYIAGSTNASFDKQKNMGGMDGFVFKIDNAGEKIWSRVIGTEKNDAATGLTLKGFGSQDITAKTGEGDKEPAKEGVTIIPINPLHPDTSIPTVAKEYYYKPGYGSVSVPISDDGKTGDSEIEYLETYEECKKGCILYVVGSNRELNPYSKQYDTFFIIYSNRTGEEKKSKTYHIKSLYRDPKVDTQGDFIIVKDLIKCPDWYGLCVTGHDPAKGDIKWTISAFKEYEGYTSTGNTLMAVDTLDGIYIIDPRHQSSSYPNVLYKFDKTNRDYSPVFEEGN